MRVDRPLVRLEGDATERVEELGPGEDPARAGRERGQQPELGRGEVDRPPGDLGTHPGHIEDHVACPDDVARLGGPLGASQDGLDARDELARGERLGQVVVGAHLEPEQLVELVVARGQHHDRDRGVATELAGDLETVEAGQAEVEDDEIGVLAPRGLDGARAIGCRQHGEARVLEVVARELDDLGFVVDDEDGSHDGHRRGVGETGAPPGMMPGGAWEGGRAGQPAGGVDVGGLAVGGLVV